jgi:glycosyltransferase involved in cell wall biosynthesis
LSDVQLPASGGKAKHVYFISKFQMERNWEVINIFNFGEKITAADIKILSYFQLRNFKLASFFLFLFFLFSLFAILKRRLQADIIHIHGDYPHFILGAIIKKVTGAKGLVFTYHGAFYNKWFHELFMKKCLASADLVFFTGKEVFDRYQYYCRKAFFQPSGVSAAFMKDSFEKVNVIYDVICIANVWQPKNLKLFVDIAFLCPELKFCHIGDGIDLPSLKKYSNSINVNNIIFSGSLPEWDCIERLKASRLFLLTSVHEGTPTAVMEAISIGLPVLTTNVGGIDSVVKNGINGYIIDSNNPSDFSNKLIELLADQRKLNYIRKNNLALRNSLSWNSVCDFYSNEMESII